MHSIRTKIGEGGRINIPAAFRQSLQLEPGDDIVVHIEDNTICITTPNHALLKLQAKVKKYTNDTKENISLVDELIANRRKEADHE